ncbi:MAG: hypothetical protein IJQ07_03225 [Clostridia bacterium]|nr:hypothetical protein [Clostridia bacterium]
MIFIFPYQDTSYSKLQIASETYDGTLYPPIETVPKKICNITAQRVDG